MMMYSPLHAYFFSIKGNASGLDTEIIRLRCPAWIEDQVVQLGDSGKFSFYGEFEYPLMLSILYGEGMQTIKADMFVMEDIMIDARLFLENEIENIFLRVADRRSIGFKKAKDYMDQMYIARGTSMSTINAIPTRIESMPNIGTDVYTHVYGITEKLNYIYTLKTRYGQHFEQSIFDMEDFRQVPINDERYLGFEAYKNIMTVYNEHKIQESIKWSGNPYPGFKDKVMILEQYAEEIPKVLQFEILKNLLNRYTYTALSTEDKVVYKEKIIRLTTDFPHNADVAKMHDELLSIIYSLENKPAPHFELEASNGVMKSLTDWKGKFILLDMWGSWCKPCRVHNLKLVELHQICKMNDIDVEFISISNDKDRLTWKNAIATDRMEWTQLLADDLFLKNYNIREYPTMMLVDGNGMVKKVAPSISMDDLIHYIYVDSGQ